MHDAAGRHNLMPPPDMLENVDQLHEFAVELQLEIQKRIFPAPGPAPGPGPGPGPRNTHQIRQESWARRWVRDAHSTGTVAQGLCCIGMSCSRGLAGRHRRRH